MTSLNSSQGKRDALDRATKPWVERVARLGFSAKGLVYIIIGILATQTALGRGGSTTNSRGALRTIAAAPLGSTLLILVALGLLAYAMWRFVEAAVDPKGKGDDVKGLLARTAYAIIGFFYVGLAFSALRIVQGRAEQNGSSEEDWTARLLAQPFGRWLVGLAGLAVLGFCVYRIYRAATGDLSEELRAGELSGDEAVWAKRVGAFGLAARSLVYALMGIFLLQAAVRHDASQAGGLDQALQTIASQSYGSLLLGIVAIGLVAYGIYMLLIARYRQRFVEA